MNITLKMEIQTMRKTKTITAILCSLALLAGCGNAKGATNTESTSAVTNPEHLFIRR